MAKALQFVVPAAGGTKGIIGSAIAAVGILTGNWSLVISGVSVMLSPKNKSKEQQRQADTLSLSLGETSRKMVFGRYVTGGSLMVPFNFGGTNKTDWECMRLDLADHPIDAIEGFYAGEKYYAWSGNGLQSGFNNQLDMQFVDGAAAASTSPPARFVGVPRLQSLSIDDSDRGVGASQIWVAYKADAPNATNPMWSGGRPQFKFKLRGLKVYDPRKDSTVPGGSGSHRWDDPTTHEWSENAALIRYAYERGIYVTGHQGDAAHLWVGPGQTAEQATPIERVIAAANLCDEDVALKAGGSEKRWRAAGEIGADEPFIDIMEHFAAAMGGAIVQPDGGIDVEPGHAKATVAEFTDEHLVGGETVGFADEIPSSKRITSVAAQYVEPAQGWQMHSAPVRRIGIPRAGQEEPLSLRFVTSCTQAQRCAKIKLMLAQREKRGSVVLVPDFAEVEAGDWVGWTSAKRMAGARAVFNVAAGELRGNFRNALSLSETSADVYDWNPATDEHTPGAAPTPEPSPPGALQLASVNIVAQDIDGTPGFRATWSNIGIDPAITSVTAEIRQAGSAEMTPVTGGRPETGVMQSTAGVPLRSNIEVRVRPVGPLGRKTVASSWFSFTTGGLEDLDAAVSDGVLDVSEKALWIPILQGLQNARTALRAQADAMGLTSAASSARSAYETAATALDSALSALSSPVAWSDASTYTLVSSPSTFRSAVAGAFTAQSNLQAAMALGDVAPATVGQANPLDLLQTVNADGTVAYALVWTLPASSANTETDLAGYAVRLKDDDNAGTVVFSTPFVAAAAGAQAQTSWPATVGHTYTVDQKARRRNGRESSAWSATRQRTVAATAPSGLGPSDGSVIANGQTVTGQWTNSADPRFAGNFWRRSTSATPGAGVESEYDIGPVASWSEGGLPIGAARHFWVASYDTTGQLGAYGYLGSATGQVTPLSRLDPQIVYRPGATGYFSYTGAANATFGADWDSNLTSLPGWSTDGRVPGGLNSSGDLNRNLTTARLNGSNVLRYTGGASFAGDLNATFGADWSSNLGSRPGELIDGRVGAGLLNTGDLARNLTTARLNGSNVLRFTGGGSYAGDLNATYGATLGGNLTDQSGGAVYEAQVFNSQAAFGPAKAWTFDTGTEGWTVAYAGLSAHDGLLDLTSSADHPNLLSPAVSFAGGRFPRIRARLRRTAGSTAWDGTIYYATAGHGFSGSYYKTVPKPVFWDSGEWGIVEWDMAALTAGGSDWLSSTVTALRLDLAGVTGVTVQVDWVTYGAVTVDQVGIRGITDNADRTGDNTAADFSGRGPLARARGSVGGASILGDQRVADPAWWAGGAAPSWLLAADASGAVGWPVPLVMSIYPSGGAQTLYSLPFPLRPGARYRVRGCCYGNPGTGGYFQPLFYIPGNRWQPIIGATGDASVDATTPNTGNGAMTAGGAEGGTFDFVFSVPPDSGSNFGQVRMNVGVVAGAVVHFGVVAEEVSAPGDNLPADLAGGFGVTFDDPYPFYATSSSALAMSATNARFVDGYVLPLPVGSWSGKAASTVWWLFRNLRTSTYALYASTDAGLAAAKQDRSLFFIRTAQTPDGSGSYPGGPSRPGGAGGGPGLQFE